MPKNSISPEKEKDIKKEKSHKLRTLFQPKYLHQWPFFRTFKVRESELNLLKKD